MSTPSEKERLWLICELYYPELTSTGHYLTGIGTGLADDFEVKVICAKPNYSAKGRRVPKREIYKGVEIFRVWSTTLDKNVLPLRAINMLTVSLSIFIRCCRSFKRGDKVLVATAPWSLPYSTAVAAILKGASYTVLLHDLYPETLVAVGKTRRGSIIFKLIDSLNRWLYKHASSLVVVGRDMNETVRAKIPGGEEKVVTIPNWADLDEVAPAPKESNSLLEDLGIADRFVFMNAGNLGRPTDVETLVDAADLLREDENIHFVFVGSGAKKPWLEDQVRERGLTNISVLGPRPREDQNTFLNACDVGMVALVPNMLGVAMPSRTYNILAAGKPILALCDDNSELARVIDDDGVGWHLQPRQPDKLAELIRRIATDPRALIETGRRARNAAAAKYSREDAIEHYRLTLKKTE